MASKKILTDLEVVGPVLSSRFNIGNTDNYLRYNSGDLEIFSDGTLALETSDGVLIEISDVIEVVGNIEVDGDITANVFRKTGGTSSQFLKADGSVDSTTYTGNQDLSGYLLNTTDTLTGRLTITSSVRVGNDTATATSANEGATRYYTDAAGSYMDMVMQYQNSGNSANDYKWTNVVRHIFPS